MFIVVDTVIKHREGKKISATPSCTLYLFLSLKSAVTQAFSYIKEQNTDYVIISEI